MSKTCKSCKNKLPYTNFYVDLRIKDGHSSICKECKSHKNREMYHRIKKNRISDSNLCVEYINDAKRTGCSTCPEKEIVCLQFHHVDPTKKAFTIGARRRFDIRLTHEINKCIILCANCHFKFHGGLIDISSIPHLNIPTVEEWLVSYKIEGKILPVEISVD